MKRWPQLLFNLGTESVHGLMASVTKKRTDAKAPPETEEEDGLDEVREGSADSPRAKGKGKKKGCGCSSCSKGKECPCSKSGKKTMKSDALTPQEYLAACDLGIQHRERAYIRARLDSDARFDLKCGNGAISKGEKCHKGAAKEVNTPAQSARSVAAQARGRREVASNTVKAVNRGGGWFESPTAKKQREAFQQNKGSLEGRKNKIKRGGEIAAHAGAFALKTAGLTQIVMGGGMGSVNKGAALINAGNAVTNIAQASKASRQGNTELRNAFLRSAGNQAAMGGVNYGVSKLNDRIFGGPSPSGGGGSARRKRGYQGDPFKDLGVNSKMSDDEIKKAWKTAARKHHPDMGGSEEAMKRTNTAYEEIMRRRGRKDSSFWADGFDFAKEEAY